MWTKKGGVIMTTAELDRRLEAVLHNFASEVQCQYDDYDKTPVTAGDIAELSRQTYYAMNAFRKEIIAYLESKS